MPIKNPISNEEIINDIGSVLKKIEQEINPLPRPKGRDLFKNVWGFINPLPQP